MEKELTQEYNPREKELSASNKYWFENFKLKSKQIDSLCTYAAETLGKIDYEIWKNDIGHTGGVVVAKKLIDLRGEKRALDHILIHFFGFIPLDYLIANDLGREDIERNKTRDKRYQN